MAETYFITGAQGCIGSWIVKALAERGDTSVVFDRSSDTRRLSAIMESADLERVRFVTGDVTHGRRFRRVRRHGASGSTGLQPSWRDS